MRIKSYRRGLVSILLVFTLVLSLTFVAMPVLTSEVISHPGGTTIKVNPGENFILRHRFLWDDAANSGYYLVAIYWDYFADNAWHFTLESAVAYFDNDGNNLPDPGVALIDNTVGMMDNGTRHTIGVSNAAGNDNLGTFNVDITLRASGPDNTLHVDTNNHPIEYTIVQSLESIPPAAVTPTPVTVRVLGEETPAPTAWHAALAVLIAVAILAGGYAIYSIFKAGPRKRKRKRTLRA